MNQIAVTVKLDDELKAEAQRLAKKMGLTLSAVIEGKLREFTRERRVVFEDDLVPNEAFAQELREIEQDIKAGRNITGSFHDFESLDKHLRRLGHAG